MNDMALGDVIYTVAATYVWIFVTGCFLGFWIAVLNLVLTKSKRKVS